MNAKITLILGSITSLVGLAAAQGATILYLPGKAIADQNVALRSWGSGSIRETTEAAYEGTTSISVSTKNLFQGGIMMYGSPVDLSSQFSSSDNLLRITFKLADSTMVFGPGGAPGGPGGPGGTGGPPGLPGVPGG